MRSGLTTMFASALALGVLVALPAQADRMSDWDLNGDGLVSAKEFIAGWGDEGIFYRSDLDRDGTLSKSELNEPLFSALDTNQDGVISKEEHGGGMFDRFDVNNDNQIGLAEWQSFERATQDDGWFGMGMENLYATWDTDLDGVISKREFERGLTDWKIEHEADLFQRYDVNKDQMLGRAEWGSFEDDVEAHGWFSG